MDLARCRWTGERGPWILHLVWYGRGRPRSYRLLILRQHCGIIGTASLLGVLGAVAPTRQQVPQSYLERNLVKWPPLGPGWQGR